MEAPRESAHCLYIRTIIDGLVDKLEQVVVTLEPIGDDRFVVNIAVAPEDTGKLIGKEGRMARSIRTIAGAYAKREKVKLQLNIIQRTGEAVA